MNDRAKTIIAAIIFLIIGIGIGYTLSYRNIISNDQNKGESTGIGPAVGTELKKEITLITEGGGLKKISEYRGSALLINFWASWCGPCMIEMPGIFAVQKKYKKQGLEVLAINLDDNIFTGRLMLEKRIGKPAFPLFQGMNSDILRIFPLEGIPYTILVDKKGIIRYSEAGEINWLTKENLKKIEDIL